MSSETTEQGSRLFLSYSRLDSAFVDELIISIESYGFEVLLDRQDDARPSVRLQAWGESVDPFRLDKLYALDERLNRQFEKALSMLIRLKEMRAAAQLGSTGSAGTYTGP